MRKSLSALLIAAALSAGVVVTPASAAPRESGFECNPLDSGLLCLLVEARDVGVAYDKNSGNPIWVRFGYDHAGVSHASPEEVEIYPDETKSSVWLEQNLQCGQDIVGWMEVRGQRRFQTPAVRIC
ncbi:hypothetical protein B0I31_11910 [Saccharothrix carnea]|uniref:Peptidase inhibitor family I36 n=1 Tax=Saccharothrix carnea TaxID=1280637 RepID=A0A2P8HZC6_SACCR|nr:hypothetical protein [Saccharothrix carnea]PSL51580.1 hypothetical protein B0I31_11910 [Saccharothrix carnea]